MLELEFKHCALEFVFVLFGLRVNTSQSTAMVMSRLSVNLTTLFPGHA